MGSKHVRDGMGASKRRQIFHLEFFINCVVFYARQRYFLEPFTEHNARYYHTYLPFTLVYWHSGNLYAFQIELVNTSQNEWTEWNGFLLSDSHAHTHTHTNCIYKSAYKCLPPTTNHFIALRYIEMDQKRWWLWLYECFMWVFGQMHFAFLSIQSQNNGEVHNQSLV